MPNRRLIGLRFVAVAVLAAGATYSALGQAPQPAAPAATPKYYPGSITPNPAYNATYNPPAPARQPPPQPPVRLTQPVVAGPGGVRPVSAQDTDLGKTPLPPTGDMPKPPAPGELPKPAFFPPPAMPDLTPAPPTDPKPAPLPLPDAMKPPVVISERGPSTPPALPPGLDAPKPITPAPMPLAPVPTAPQAGSLSASAKANVGVEIEAPDAVSVGQPCVYHLVVRNTGTAAVNNVRVEHELPTGVTLGGTEPPAENAGDGKLAWALGAMDAGAEKKIKVTVTPADEGELRGRASVTFATAVEARVKVTRPRIAVAVTGPETVRVGEPVAFRVKLNNTGSGPARKIRLHARFTEGLKHTSGQVIEGTLEKELPAGESKEFELRVTAARPGSETLILSVFADSNQPETAKAAVTLVEPQLVVKQTGPARCLVRAEPLYQIDLSNPGSAATDAIQMWTAVPDGFEFVQASDGGQFDPRNKSVVWRLNGLPAGGNKAITVKLRAMAPADGVVRTTAQAGGEGAKGKPLEARGETTVHAEGVAALRFDLSGQDGLVEVGKEAIYEIKVVNHGTGPCTNVQLVAELADGTAMTASAGPTTGRASGGQVVFEPLPQMNARGEAVFKMRVKGNVPGDLRFRVKLTCDQMKTPVVKEENTKFYKE